MFSKGYKMTNKEKEQIEEQWELQPFEKIPLQSKFTFKVKISKTAQQKWDDLRIKIQEAKVNLKFLHKTQIKDYAKFKAMQITPWRNRKHAYLADIQSRLDKRKRTITIETYKYRQLKEQRNSLWFEKYDERIANFTTSVEKILSESVIDNELVTNIINFPTFKKIGRSISNIFTKFVPKHPEYPSIYK